MTKYIVSRTEVYKNIKTMVDYDPDPKVIGKFNGAQMDKIFEHPITAIAYDVFDEPEDGKEFEFDKKDIIKALDFWINDKVLENERLLKLNGRLQDFHEEELKDLISIRSEVLEMDNDTKFKRFSPNYYGAGNSDCQLVSDNVKFYYTKKPVLGPPKPEKPKYNSNNLIGELFTDRISSPWTTFNHIWGQPIVSNDELFWRPLGARHSNSSSSLTNNRITRVNVGLEPRTRAGLTITQGHPNPHNWSVKQMGNGITWGFFDHNDALIRIGEHYMNDFANSRMAEESLRQHRFVYDRRDRLNPVTTLPEPPPPQQQEEPLRMGDRVVWDVDHFRRANPDNDSPAQIIHLSTETQSPEFLRWVLEGTFVIPQGSGRFSVGDMLDIRGNNDVVIVNARIAESLNEGDMIRLNENREWVKVIPPVPEPEGHLLVNSAPLGTAIIGTAGEDLRPGDLIYRDDNNMRWYKARPINPPNSQGVRIVVQPTSEGNMIEGVSEGVFHYRGMYVPVLRPGDSVSVQNGNTFVTRRSRETTEGLLRNMGLPSNALNDLTESLNALARNAAPVNTGRLREASSTTEDLVRLNASVGNNNIPITMTREGFRIWSEELREIDSFGRFQPTDRLDEFKGMTLQQRNVIEGTNNIFLKFIGPTQENVISNYLRTVEFTVSIIDETWRNRYINPELDGTWDISLLNEHALIIDHLEHRLESPIHVTYGTIGDMANGNATTIPDLRTVPSFMEFINIYVNSMSTSVGPDMACLDLEFLGNGARISCKFGTDNMPVWNIDDHSPHIVRILGRNKVLLDGTEYSVLEPIRVVWDRIHEPPRTHSDADTEGNFVDYYNMSCYYDGSNASWAGENSYVTATIKVTGSLLDAIMTVYVTGNQIERVLDGWHLKTLRIYHDRKDIVKINDQRIYVMNMEIHYK